MQTQIQRVEAALRELKQGKMIILADDPDRENEGDLIVAAEMITPDIMNFMIRNGSGIVCLAMTGDGLAKLDLPLMVPANENSSLRGTPFTISIDAKEGITTGVSASDRTATILAAVNDNAHPSDLVKPGHIFPLQAMPGGVLERQGHTEGSVDLMQLAGFKPAAVLCEIMNPDGTMTCGSQLADFATKHNLTMLSIEDIMNYRLQNENLIADQTTTMLPIEKYGMFRMTVIKEKITDVEHVIIAKGDINTNGSTLVRIHSACTTGDLFTSERCDCHKQLQYSLKRISEEGGILIYLNQEGRGIGLFNKIKAYALQDNGLDTVEANEQLGLPVDSRRYHIAANILRNMQVLNIRLLTNNPNKISDLHKFGIDHIEREVMPIFHNDNNLRYLNTKRDKLNHHIAIDILASTQKGSS